MLSLLLRCVEKIINCALAADPDSVERLVPLQKKCCRVELQDWHVEVDVLATAQGLSLYPAGSSQEVDCSIHTNLSSLLHMLREHKAERATLTPGIEIHGQSHVAQALMNLLFKLDIDWEQGLSRYVGKAMAFRLLQSVREVRQGATRIRGELARQAMEYLQKEARMLPEMAAVQDFTQQITQLHYAVDRLEARIAHLNDYKK